MSQVQPTAEDKPVLETRYKKVRDIREGDDRIKAVLLSSEGWSTSMIAQALRKHASCILHHLKDYIEAQKLHYANGGSREKLSEAKTETLIIHLTEELYQHNHQIVAYIKECFWIDYTVSALHKWLHRHGFVYKQLKGVPVKANIEQQQAFIEKDKKLKSSVGQDELILFGEEVHSTQATKLLYGGIKKGTDKAIKTTASRTRINLVAVIELAALSKTVTAIYEMLNAQSIIDFMSRLWRQYINTKTIHWIIDEAGVSSGATCESKRT